MAFDPASKIVKLRGKEYLEVKWRLVWFHDQIPDGSIKTELVDHNIIYEEKEVQVGKDKKVQKKVSDLSNATFKAAVLIPWQKQEGWTVFREFTGYGSEEASDFGDYLEKAETKAIGRALAAAGFGTQFAPDHDMVKEDGSIGPVDSPVERPEPSFSFSSKDDDGSF